MRVSSRCRVIIFKKRNVIDVAVIVIVDCIGDRYKRCRSYFSLFFFLAKEPLASSVDEEGCTVRAKSELVTSLFGTSPRESFMR